MSANDLNNDFKLVEIPLSISYTYSWLRVDFTRRIRKVIRIFNLLMQQKTHTQGNQKPTGFH